MVGIPDPLGGADTLGFAEEAVTGIPVNSPSRPRVIAVTFWTSAGIAGYSAAIPRVAPGVKPEPLVVPVGL